MTRAEILSFFAERQQAWHWRDIEALVASHTEDGVAVSPIFKTLRGRAQLRAAYCALFAAFPDWDYHSDEVLIDGEDVAELFTVTGTHLESLHNLPAPTGRKFKFHGVLRCSFEGNKIAHERRIYDFHTWLENLEHARLDRDLKLAAEIQEALLPRTRHIGAFYEAVGASQACRAIGGDFFEYIDLPSGDFVVALGDVAGKGMPAALLGAAVQGILSTEAASGCGPAATLAHVNNAIIRRGVDARFATAFCATLSAHGRFIYSNAGHNPPLLISARDVRQLDGDGTVLGIFSDASFQERTVELRPSDTILLYSDGATEAESASGDWLGEERLTACVESNRHQSPADLLQCVFEMVQRFSHGAVQSDDITAVVLRFGGTDNAGCVQATTS